MSAGRLLGEPASSSPATITVLLATATTLKGATTCSPATPPARFLRVKAIAAP